MLTFQSATSSKFLVPLDLQNIFWRSAKLPKDITSISGFQQSIGGKVPIVQKTDDGKVLGDKNKNLKRVDVRFKFGGFATIRETTVNLSGSVPWEMTYRVLTRLVPEIKTLKFTLTNTAVRFYLKKQVRIENIARQKISDVDYTLSYDPELYFQRLLFKFFDGVVASVFANGTVVAQGRDLKDIEARVKNVLSKYKNPYGAEMKKTPVATRKNLAGKRAAMTEARYERASNWSNMKNGYYVRPGPNKQPRFYTIPKNPAFVRQKVLRAYANIGVNVPIHVKRILGIVNSKVKPKVIPKKTVNWNSNAPNGFYIRPGPGGLPKYYKIPKLISQGKKTVIESYKKAGINVPNKVKNIFGIKNIIETKSPELRGNVSSKGIFRIDGLNCMRYKLEDLKKIALKLNIPIVKQTKQQLCRAIRSKIYSNRKLPISTEPNFVKNGVKHYILVNDRKVMRNTRSKSMNSFKINELKNMILKLNDTSNVKNKKKKNLIELLIERKRTKNISNRLFNSPVSSVSSSASSSDESPLYRNPLNIAKDILGNGFTNNELGEFLNMYKNLPLNSKGSVNSKAYQNLVNMFKNRKVIRERLSHENKGPKRMMKVNVESL